LVDYYTKEPTGTIIIDTPNTYLYLVLGNGRALRYGIGVGREGFTWAAAQSRGPSTRKNSGTEEPFLPLVSKAIFWCLAFDGDV
jgi:lipoprotein-anchoring transpeptidase ErfK/SrfK